MGSKLSVLAALATLAICAPSSAHHNPGVIFDLAQVVTVEGVVTRFNPGNPHVRIYFTRTDGVGPEGQEWMAEGGSRTVLLRRDWTQDMLKAGDAVTIVGHAARDAADPVVHMERLTLPDGRTVWAEDLPPPEALRALLERRVAGQGGAEQ